MRTGVLVLLTIAVAVSAAATPPDRGGVMMAADSSLILYWLHPDINCYEQGHDDESEILALVGGEAVGSYAVAVKFTVPFAAQMISTRTKIFMTDQYPDNPGDRYSPFRTAIHKAGPGDFPAEPPLVSETCQMCGGLPCLHEWFEKPVNISDMTAGDFWWVFQWADSTPTAPQLKGRVRRVDDPPVLLGCGTGSGMNWSDLYLIPASRQRLLGIVPLDTNVVIGWRRPVAGTPPDSFLISTFRDNAVAGEFPHTNPDTLMHRLPDADFDSIRVRSCYDGIADDTAWTVTFDKSNTPPVMADLIFPETKMNPVAILHVANLADESISLHMAYDHDALKFDTDSISLAGRETRTIYGNVIEPPGDTIDVMIVIAADDDRYYPLAVLSTYPQAGQTDAAENGGNVPSASDPRLMLYPNPCFRSLIIADDNFRAVREIAVYNVIGQKIADIAPPFRARMAWDGCDRHGQPVPAGVYFVRIRYDHDAVTKSVLLMR